MKLGNVFKTNGGVVYLVVSEQFCHDDGCEYVHYRPMIIERDNKFKLMSAGVIPGLKSDGFYPGDELIVDSLEQYYCEKICNDVMTAVESCSSDDFSIDRKKRILRAAFEQLKESF